MPTIVTMPKWGLTMTTGTITDAWPVARGETWTSDYGTLPVRRLTLAIR